MAEAKSRNASPPSDPMGIVIRVDDKEATIYAFPASVYGTKEIKIDFTDKSQLSVGMWIYLKEKQGEEGYLFRLPKSDPVPMKSTVNPNGEVELRGRILLRKGDLGCQAWSPDLGKVGALMEGKNVEPGLYEVSLKRYIRKETKRQKQIDELYGKFDFAVVPEREMTLISPLAADSNSLLLEESLIQSTGVVTEGDGKSYVVWSSPVCRAAVASKKAFLKIGDWITFFCKLPGYGQSPVITDYMKIEPLVPTEYRAGELYIEVGGYEELLAKDIKNCIKEKVPGETQWTVWADNKWESASELPSNAEAKSITTFLGKSESTHKDGRSVYGKQPTAAASAAAPFSKKHSPTQRFRKAPQYFGRNNTEEFDGVVIKDSACNGSQLYVCPLKGEPIIALKYPWYCDNAPIAVGDWVRVTAARNAEAAYISEVPPYLLEGRVLPTRVGSAGKIEVQTQISNIWRTEFDVFGMSDKLGKVKDIYESIPRDCERDDVFLVWCYPLIRSVNNSYWALVKGETVCPIGKKLIDIEENLTEYLQQHGSQRQDSEGYFSDEVVEEDVNRTCGMKDISIKKGVGIGAKEFFSSVRHVISDEQMQKMLYNMDNSLWVDILRSAAF